MDHETDVAVPKAREADERIAAFKRGAPLPKPVSEAPRRQEKAVRSPGTTTPTKPESAPRVERAAPTEKPALAPSRERTETSARPPATDDQGPASDVVAPQSGARRRSRGGRGRGGRGTGGGAGSVREAQISTGTNQSDEARAGTSGVPAKSPTHRAAAPASDTVSEVQGDATTSDGPSETPSSSARRRRRRGGRGRGGGASGGSARVVNVDGVDASPEAQTEESQRDDAVPDVPGDTRSRGRGSRGGSKQLTVEEQVASGGPTRSIKGSRNRSGRAGRDGRRRREPTILPPRITDKLMVITERGERDQIAVLEEDVLVQHYVTRQGATSMVGNVYLGRVQNVLPGMEAAFVDIGRGRNGVLYAGEVNYRPEDLEGPAPRIENVLKPGQAVMVQITKDPMGGKGARLTAQISLPGRYLVLAPDQELSGISRRLGDNERKRLKTILRKVQPAGHGVIVRTAAEGAAEEAFVHDMKRLIGLWEDIQRQAKKVKAPAVLYEEPELTLRVFRDLFTDEEFKGLVTDSPRVYEQVLAYVRDIAPDLEPKVTLHRGKLSAFEEHRIEEQIHKTLDRKVWLPSGGYLIIERTEAMTIVDVNTGKSVGKTNLEETVVNTNLEAAKEVARQLRLRDIGGIIVVDFIDMLLDKNKGEVEETMKEAMALDKTRSQVFEIGPLGLLQVTRKRVSSGLVESFSETCPTCEGRGILINYEF